MYAGGNADIEGGICVEGASKGGGGGRIEEIGAEFEVYDCCGVCGLRFTFGADCCLPSGPFERAACPGGAYDLADLGLLKAACLAARWTCPGLIAEGAGDAWLDAGSWL